MAKPKKVEKPWVLRSRFDFTPEPVVKCAWCGMFGKESRYIKGMYDHMEKPLTDHPFVAYREVVGA